MIEGTLIETRTGLILVVRPAHPGEEPALRHFFEHVSEDDRRFRFLSAGATVGHDQLAPLLDADHLRSESWIARDHISGEIVASAMLACDASLTTAEIAVSVREDRKGRGIGWALLDFLAEEARVWGVKRVISIEARANHDAIDLEREQGFLPQPVEGDPTLVMLARSFA